MRRVRDVVARDPASLNREAKGPGEENEARPWSPLALAVGLFISGEANARRLKAANGNWRGCQRASKSISSLAFTCSFLALTGA